MTWDTLIRETARDSQLTIKATRAILESAFTHIKDSVLHGGRVGVPGFGVFIRKSRAARNVRDIKSKDLIRVPAHTLVGFRAARDAKR
jgi:DNA-binding protein HU-beta